MTLTTAGDKNCPILLTRGLAITITLYFKCSCSSTQAFSVWAIASVKVKTREEQYKREDAYFSCVHRNE